MVGFFSIRDEGRDSSWLDSISLKTSWSNLTVSEMKDVDLNTLEKRDTL